VSFHGQRLDCNQATSKLSVSWVQ